MNPTLTTLITMTLIVGEPAQANNFNGQPAPMASMPVMSMRPPVQYQGAAQFNLHTMPSYEVGGVCHVLGADAYPLACEQAGTVFMPNPCEFRGDVYAEMLCHESGHKQGWPANHPKEMTR